MKVKLNLSLEEHVVDRIKRSNWGSASEYITSLVQKDMLVGKDALKGIHSKLDTLLRIVNREGETTMSVTEQELQSFDEYLNKEKIAMTKGEFYYTKEFQELLELANNKEERSMERIAEQVMALLQVTPERAFELLRDGEIREKFVEHIGNAWVVIGEQQAEIELLKNAKESTMEHCKYLDSLLERTDEGSIALLWIMPCQSTRLMCVAAGITKMRLRNCQSLWLSGLSRRLFMSCTVLQR